MRKIELLAPAKNFETGRYAIQYGADAVYIGASELGARVGATNSVEEIARLVEYAKHFGVKVYATLNTIVYEDELLRAKELANTLIDIGVDALIIQDMCYTQMELEGVELHASTQTFNDSPEKVKFLSDSGFSRVILERNLSLEQIKEIRKSTNVDLECFVHGAICVCHSGRCYMSKSLSQRSGNRGECSQPCRLTYDLLSSNFKPIIRGKHLLSVQDLDLTSHIGELINAGVTSFKIEGRLKDENYVKNIVSHYRKIIDQEIAKRNNLVRASVGVSMLDFEPNPSKSFTRGRSDYFFSGKQQGVASFETSKSLGEKIGKITSVSADSFKLNSDIKLSAGDGICFVCEGDLCGTNINRVENRQVFPNKMDNLVIGTVVFRNYDHTFNTILEQSRTKRLISVKATLTLSDNQIELTLVDCEGVTSSVCVSGEWEEAKNPGKMEDVIRTQLSKSGNTIFDISEVDIVGSMVFMPIKELNELRRKCLDTLLNERKKPCRQPKIGEPQKREIYQKNLEGEWNVVNSLAEQFYRSCGVETIEEGYDLSENLKGIEVMTTPYCIRREIGECLKDGSELNNPLYIGRGTMKCELQFDCEKCEMKIIKL